MKLWGCRSCMVSCCGQLYIWITWRVLCISIVMDCVPVLVISWTLWRVIVLVGHGNSDAILAGIWMAALFVVNVACAQKSSRSTSTFNSQIVASVPQSAWSKIMIYEYMHCTYYACIYSLHFYTVTVPAGGCMKSLTSSTNLVACDVFLPVVLIIYETKVIVALPFSC